MTPLILSPPVVKKIFQYLDPPSALSLSQACRQFRALLTQSIFPTEYPRPATSHLLITGPESGAKTASSSETETIDNVSLASTETEVTTVQEEEWESKIISDIVQRLSLLPRRTHGITLASLPAELQLEIFNYLDKIDSCCLGLTSPNLYVVYRAVHGTKMPLNTRRIGPNLLELAWEVVGRQECRQCGIYRCELHQHIKSWMPSGLEYCAMKQNFGLPAKNGSKSNCYRSKPSKPRRCGRHPMRTMTIHQDDPSFSL